MPCSSHACSPSSFSLVLCSTVRLCPKRKVHFEICWETLPLFRTCIKKKKKKKKKKNATRARPRELVQRGWAMDEVERLRKELAKAKQLQAQAEQDAQDADADAHRFVSAQNESLSLPSFPLLSFFLSFFLLSFLLSFLPYMLTLPCFVVCCRFEQALLKTKQELAELKSFTGTHSIEERQLRWENPCVCVCVCVCVHVCTCVRAYMCLGIHKALEGCLLGLVWFALNAGKNWRTARRRQVN